MNEGHPLFRPARLPNISVRPGGPARIYGGPPGSDERHKELHLLGRGHGLGHGEFLARLFDGRSYFLPVESSRRVKLSYELDSRGQPVRGADGLPRATRVPGHWVEIPKEEQFFRVGDAPYGEAHRIPLGRGGTRALQVQFFQLAGENQDVRLSKPAALLSEVTPFGTFPLSSIHNGIDTNTGEGFVKQPPQSHFTDPIATSATFGKWIDPGKVDVLTPALAVANYWDNASSLRVRLKRGCTQMRLWDPSGEYSEWDLSDQARYKVTTVPNFHAERVSCPIKVGESVATHWDLYLMPRRIQGLVFWITYYWAITPFTFFIFGINKLRNYLDRIPIFPVPYGMLSEVATLITDWTYYVARWNGPFSPPVSNAHPRPVGFHAAGGEGAFNPALLTGGVWAEPQRESDYAVEYAIVHNVLIKDNPLDLVTSSPFFAIVYDSTSPISYVARPTLQQPGDLLAKIVSYGHARRPGQTFYVWSRTAHTISPLRTLAASSFFYDPLAGNEQFSLQNALALGGWR